MESVFNIETITGKRKSSWSGKIISFFQKKMIISKCWNAVYHEPKKQKYGSVKTNWYDSKKESKRAFELKILEKVWKIQNLREQISFLLQESYIYNWKKIQPIHYIADFVYDKDWKTIVEDVKWFKTEIYKIKKKLLLFRYPYIVFLET